MHRSVFPGPQARSEFLPLGLRPRHPSLLSFHLRLLPRAVRLSTVPSRPLSWTCHSPWLSPVHITFRVSPPPSPRCPCPMVPSQGPRTQAPSPDRHQGSSWTAPVSPSLPYVTARVVNTLCPSALSRVFHRSISTGLSALILPVVRPCDLSAVQAPGLEVVLPSLGSPPGLPISLWLCRGALHIWAGVEGSHPGHAPCFLPPARAVPLLGGLEARLRCPCGARPALPSFHRGSPSFMSRPPWPAGPLLASRIRLSWLDPHTWHVAGLQYPFGG